MTARSQSKSIASCALRRQLRRTVGHLYSGLVVNRVHRCRYLGDAHGLVRERFDEARAVARLTCCRVRTLTKPLGGHYLSTPDLYFGEVVSHFDQMRSLFVAR